ncbi:2Fe-2S iron-sulfur cluster binding domain-containing protein [bacterium]|nr:2Fe-2S iron-sulfur cluster binding domain-containing protein [bacterium]
MNLVLIVLVVSVIAAVLAAVLVFADTYINNYGECEIDVNEGTRTYTVKGGTSLLGALTDQKLFIPSACGGRGTCGYCKVKVIDGGGPVLPTEDGFLSPEEKKENVRLSCQVKVRGNIKIRIPDDLLSVREFTCVCSRIRELTYDIREFRFTLEEPDSITFVPGQYVQLLSPVYAGSSEEVYRAYSISSNPADTAAIELVIRLVPGGICTTYCFEHLKEGSPVRFNGPYGEFRMSDTDAPMIMIAGGSGMAPFNSILHQMKSTGCTRTAVYFFGARKVRDLFYIDEMRAFEKELPNFTFIPVLSEPQGEQWDGETGLVTEAVQRHFNDASGHEAYLCGSPGMIDASIVVLKKLGVPEDRIYYDKFS